MIFVFDFPKKTDKEGDYDHWPEIFNGLIGLPENSKSMHLKGIPIIFFTLEIFLSS